MKNITSNRDREIKFRGLRTDGQGWVYGSLNAYTDGKRIITNTDGTQSWIVTPDTVGQFTGLKDKKNVEIYEADIITTETNKNMVIDWSVKFASFIIKRDDWAFSHWFGESCNSEDCTVIGNIIESIHLLALNSDEDY